ncbi:MAG: very short patch repair endonuclease [Elusimicrobia bacterium]|nr:very short patch repair endonuclease [Elusimicrobiota bacterium]
MRSVKNKDSKIEVLFRKALWRAGFRYRKNVQQYLGKPDIVLKKYKTVIFIDSCFWHYCSKHCRVPALHKTYWLAKLKKNKMRDAKINSAYKRDGWQVIRIWEHELKKFVQS